MKKIQESKIYEAAEGFVKMHGKTPTWRELRDLLGGGSPATLNKYYRPWRDKRDQELAAANAVDVPTIERVLIPNPVLEVLNGEWSRAIGAVKNEAQRELAAIRAMCRKENDDLVAKVAERDEIIDILESEAVECQESFEKALTFLRIEIDAHKKELGEQFAEIKSKQKDIGNLNGRILEMEKQLLNEKDAILIERKLTDDAKALSVRLQAQLTMAENEIDKLSRTLNENK